MSKKKYQSNDISWLNKYIKKNNVKYLCGLDEVGRGAIAGDLYVGAVIFPIDYQNKEIKDSKKLTAKKRLKLYDIIIKDCLFYSIIKISVSTINEIGIQKAVFLGFKKAIDELPIKPDLIIVDGNKKIPSYNGKQFAIIKADDKIVAVSGASILAKVSRDEYMCLMKKEFPNFSFDKHKGYCTTKHIEEIKKFGTTPIHRTKFEVFKKILKNK